MKQEGNESFRASQWSEALVSYRTALSRLPTRMKQSVAPDSLQDDSSDEGARSKLSKVSTQKEDSEQADAPTELEGECAKVRAVLNANIGACLVKLVCEYMLNVSGYLPNFNNLGRL